MLFLTELFKIQLFAIARFSFVSKWFHMWMEYTRCDQKITVIYKISWVTYIQFSHFFCYISTHVCYICWHYQPFWIVCLFLTDKKVSRGLMCCLIFYYSNKWKLNVQGHLKCWLWPLASLLWAEPKFNCGITGLKKTQKMSMTMLVLVARAHQQPMKALKRWGKWFPIIVESLLKKLLMMLAYRSAHSKQFLRMF